MSLGKSLVGLSFNPSQLDSVSKCKEHFADVIDLLESQRTTENARFVDQAINEIITAQMWSVKALTWK